MGDRMLERADADKNGVVTREEFRAVAARVFDRLPVVERSRDQRCDIGRTLRERRFGDAGSELLEVLLASHEIGLAIHFDHRRAPAVAGTLDYDHAFGGDARRLLVGLREAGLAHELSRGIEVAVGFYERLLALHHPRARAFAKHLH